MCVCGCVCKAENHACDYMHYKCIRMYIELEKHMLIIKMQVCSEAYIFSY